MASGPDGAGLAASPFFSNPGVTRLQGASHNAWPVAADWRVLVDQFFDDPVGKQLQGFLGQRLALGATIYPAQPLRALEVTPLASVKVVILGQDPYHGPGQAEGLAFSVPDSVPAPPSLRNICKELQRDLGAILAPGHSLLPWAEQGVLLLNSCLTVEGGQPAGHANRGWETLTDQIIIEVASRSPACVFMLWGAHAQKKSLLIARAAQGRETLILQANHPSPLSALRGPTPFIGCGHFSKTAHWLRERGHKIDWVGHG